MKKKLVIFLVLLFFSCKKFSRYTSTTQDASHTSISSEVTPIVQLQKISFDQLDSESFRIFGISIGLQSLYNSKTPVIVFTLPKLADYAQIIRCKANTKIYAGVSTINLMNLGSGKYSVSQVGSILRSANYFVAAKNNKNCELLTQSGTVSATGYSDIWCPSGSYQWLVRACVTPQRIIDPIQSRNCSLLVGVSSLLQDYINSRLDSENNNLYKMSLTENEMDNVFSLWRQKARDYAYYLQQCNEQNHQRQVNKVYLEAVSKIAAASIEFPYELRQYLKKGAQKGIFAKFLSISSLAIGLQGMMFSTPFSLLLSSPEDAVPRTCAKALGIRIEFDKMTKDLMLKSIMYTNSYNEFIKAKKTQGSGFNNEEKK